MKRPLDLCRALWKFVSFVPQHNSEREYVNIMEIFDPEACFSFSTHKVGISNHNKMIICNSIVKTS